jgi:hypothetical protein
MEDVDLFLTQNNTKRFYGFRMTFILLRREKLLRIRQTEELNTKKQKNDITVKANISLNIKQKKTKVDCNGEKKETSQKIQFASFFISNIEITLGRL